MTCNALGRYATIPFVLGDFVIFVKRRNRNFPSWTDEADLTQDVAEEQAVDCRKFTLVQFWITDGQAIYACRPRPASRVDRRFPDSGAAERLLSANVRHRRPRCPRAGGAQYAEDAGDADPSPSPQKSRRLLRLWLWKATAKVSINREDWKVVGPTRPLGHGIADATEPPMQL